MAQVLGSRRQPPAQGAAGACGVVGALVAAGFASPWGAAGFGSGSIRLSDEVITSAAKPAAG